MELHVLDEQEVSIVGDDWRGPLHQWEDLTRYKERLPYKIQPAGKWLTEQLPGSVLDIGCCGGYLLDHLRRSGKMFSYKGVDFDVDAAIQLHPDDQALFSAVDFFDIQEKYDYIFCARVVLHLPDWRSALDKLLQLANKAVVVVTTVGTVGCVSRQTTEAGFVYRVTINKQTLEKEYRPEWIEYKPDKYGTFILWP